jgi:hypothetical protein
MLLPTIDRTHKTSPRRTRESGEGPQRIRLHNRGPIAHPSVKSAGAKYHNTVKSGLVRGLTAAGQGVPTVRVLAATRFALRPAIPFGTAAGFALTAVGLAAAIRAGRTRGFALRPAIPFGTAAGFALTAVGLAAAIRAGRTRGGCQTRRPFRTNDFRDSRMSRHLRRTDPLHHLGRSVLGRVIARATRLGLLTASLILLTADRLFGVDFRR